MAARERLSREVVDKTQSVLSFSEALAAKMEGRYNVAEAAFRRLCEGGSLSACFGLGTMYYNGHGVPQDYSRAAELYRQACDGGYADGCFFLGNMYAEGRGVQQDRSRAVELMEKRDVQQDHGPIEVPTGKKNTIPLR